MAAPHELDLVQQYTVHPYDQVLGVYFAQARMYDAADRRFMAVDPVKGWIADPITLPQYTYCLSNPVKYIDPFGLILNNIDLNIIAYGYARGLQTDLDRQMTALTLASRMIVTTGNWMDIAHTLAQVFLAGKLWKAGYAFVLEKQFKQVMDTGKIKYSYADIVAFMPEEGPYYLIEVKPYHRTRAENDLAIAQIEDYFALLSCQKKDRKRGVAYFPDSSFQEFEEKFYMNNDYSLFMKVNNQSKGIFGYRLRVEFNNDKARKKYGMVDKEIDYNEFKQLYNPHVLDYQTGLYNPAARELYAKTGLNPAFYSIQDAIRRQTLMDAANVSLLIEGTVIAGTVLVTTGSSLYWWTMGIVGAGSISIPAIVAGTKAATITLVPEIYRIIGYTLSSELWAA
jgi:RHS repeat-associated protein